MILYKLFPTVVSKHSLGRQFTRSEMDYFYSHVEMRKNYGNLNTVNTNILDHDIVLNIKTQILNYINEYIENIFKPIEKVTPYLTQSWINYTENNGWHHKHNHYNSFLSGVLYLNTSVEDKITFHKPGYTQIYLHSNKWDDVNSLSWNIEVESGDIILFPSSLEHEVTQINTEMPRVSLAFNSFLRGNLGDELQLTKLKI